MLSLSFSVDAVPVPQPRHRVGAGYKGGKPHAYLPREHPIHVFKAVVALRAREAMTAKGWLPLQGPVVLRLVFVLPRPVWLVWKTRPMPRRVCSCKPDLSNLVKGCEDAILQIGYVDDSQIVRLEAEKVYAAGDEKPHVEVTLTQQEA